MLSLYFRVFILGMHNVPLLSDWIAGELFSGSWEGEMPAFEVRLFGNQL